MPHALRSPASLFACVAMCGATTGCATTGLAWVHEREDGVDLRAPDPDPRTHERVAALAATDAPDRREPPRPRLDHSITLGGEAAPSDVRPTYASAPSGQPIVNVYVMPSPYAPAYGAAYPGYGYPSFAFGAPIVQRGATMVQSAPALRPGLDWPAVPNHGPAFPYRTGPASPWSGENPRRNP